jgi:hypothetical protein
MKFVALLHTNIGEDQLAILFNSLIVEDIVSILWHQYEMVSNLTIAMAKTVQFQRISHPGHRVAGTTCGHGAKKAHFTKK